MDGGGAAALLRQASPWSLLSGAAAVLHLWWAAQVLEWAWLAPRRMERALRAQGLRRTRYRFLWGDLKEECPWTGPTTSSRVSPLLHRAVEDHVNSIILKVTKITVIVHPLVFGSDSPMVWHGMELWKRRQSLGDVMYPPDVMLVIPIMFIHRDPELWGHDAGEFNPGRFAEGVSKACSDPSAFIPFSWGPRICIGQNFALLEAKLAISMVLQRFAFELSPEYVHTLYSIITLHPQHKVLVRVRRL
ncbi:Cytochrome P450 72A14 [Dichanthelium oligosanthes]|uniref:Cytochrome P450 72A14 n=1 Tax=Dichanthelium oligosanthes TaxID=888268 RepID=A0A1E5UWN1_9POAL|nr:Cytochrome P450 72A14 [Dichanthelium oligosanthes]